MKINIFKKIFICNIFFIFYYSNAQVYSEKYRPKFHLSSKDSNMADPKGLFIYDGIYHLFFYGQWEHAISNDLIHWKELPDPMKGGPQPFSHFTGSVVVDKQNTSGFGKNSMVSIYTRHFPGDSLPETQCLNISKDGGVEFHYYEQNPVLDIGKKFFRDPQVFWHEPSQMWKMVVSIANEHKIPVYESKDLKKWQYCSTFGDLGAQTAFWECPDLFELPVIGQQGTKKWVMIIGRGPNKVQYFIGDFDGKNFIPDSKTTNYLKYGQGINGEIFEDFESNYKSQWHIQKLNCKREEKTTNPVGYLGQGFSGLSTTNSTGIMKSKPFKINKNAINFLIAGGQSIDSLCFRLIVDNKVVRSSTGENKNILKWDGWDVRDLKGKKAYLEILDLVDNKENNSIFVDHIIFDDQLRNFGLEHALWLDYGDDFYATKTWRNYDDNLKLLDSTIMISWMGNWKYARQQPSSWGHGFQSLPRNISLKETTNGYKIIQKPINQLKKLRNNPSHFSNLIINDDSYKLSQLPLKRNTYEIEAEINCKSKSKFGFNLLVGEGRNLKLTVDPKISTICLDRTNCTDYLSNENFTKNFATKMYAPVSIENDILKLHIFVDESSIEIFLNDGETTLSAATYPSENQTGVEAFSENGKTEFTSIKIWDLKSIWEDSN